MSLGQGSAMEWWRPAGVGSYVLGGLACPTRETERQD